MNIYISLISSKFSFQFEYSVSLSLFNRCLTCISMFYASDNFYNIASKTPQDFNTIKKILLSLTRHDYHTLKYNISLFIALIVFKYIYPENYGQFIINQTNDICPSTMRVHHALSLSLSLHFHSKFFFSNISCLMITACIISSLL